jgi:phytoene synthase
MSDSVVLESEATIEKGSQSFAAAAKLFDRRTRDDAVMLYTWCRYCDDVIDGQDLGHQAKAAPDQEVQIARLHDLQVKTDEALSGRKSSDLQFEALRRVVERNDIDPRYPLQLLQGFEMDVRRTSYRTLSDTKLYCYHVAGVVGVMMAMIMGARNTLTLDRASDLGIAFQLTNICRDIIDDAREGRCYVPSEMLADAGIRSIDANDMDQRSKLYSVAVSLLEIADRYYDSAYVGLPNLCFRSAWAIASARRVYRAIGRKLIRLGPQAWDQRVSTSGWTKAALVALALGDVLLTRVYRPSYSRTGLFDRPVA